LNTKGTVFVDQNAARFASAPLLPLFVAVDTLHSSDAVSYDWRAADFITDRNGLRKLIRWAEGSAKLKDFRIDVELLGHRTILLGRWEARNLEAANEWSFGFGFERITTRPETGCEDGTGHHRIVSYVSFQFRGPRGGTLNIATGLGRASDDRSFRGRRLSSHEVLDPAFGHQCVQR
jgi:hypothetical protein